MESLNAEDVDGAEDSIRTVTADDFTDFVLKGEGPIAVEFMSYGCSHCGALEPILQQASSLLAGKVRIFRVNTEIDRDLSATYSVKGTPTLVMFLASRVVGRIEGPRPTVAGILTAIAQPFRDLK